MQGAFLPMGLRMLSRHLELRAETGLGLDANGCARVARSLQQAASQADALASQATDVVELEDELLAVAGDPEAASQPLTGSTYQAALKAQQAVIQRELDAGEPSLGQASRRAGLARLAIPVSADGRVVALPIVPRSRPVRVDCQGDDGDAA
jgi:hypothetical protein